MFMIRNATVCIVPKIQGLGKSDSGERPILFRAYSSGHNVLSIQSNEIVVCVYLWKCFAASGETIAILYAQKVYHL